MAVAIGFSAVNALTLSPALCALFLKPKDDESTLKERMGKAYSATGEVVKQRYGRRLKLDLHPLVTFVLLVATITFMVLGWYGFHNVALSCMAWAVAIVAVLGIFSKRFHDAFERGYERLLGKYKGGVSFFGKHKVTSFGIVVAAVAVLVWLMSSTPTALVPNEDTGTIFAMIDMPAGTSQERTLEVLDQVDSLASTIPGIAMRQMINGYSFIAGQGPTYGAFIMKLKDWSERDKSQSSDAIIQQLYALTGQHVRDGRVMIFAPPMITGYSATNGFEMKMQDRTGGDINQFFSVVQGFLAQLNARPEIQMAYTCLLYTSPSPRDP